MKFTNLIHFTSGISIIVLELQACDNSSIEAIFSKIRQAWVMAQKSFLRARVEPVLD